MPDFTQFSTSFAMSVIAMIVATIGILLVRYTPVFRDKNIDYFTAFAAGILLTAAFVHVIPEAILEFPDTAVYIAIGYFGMYLINRLLSSYVCHEHNHTHEHDGCAHERVDIRLGILAVIGIGAHSFIDGIVYSITFTHSIYTGLLASVGLILHEFAEGAVTYTLLISAKFAPRKAFIIAFITAALTTPLGLLISYPFVHHLQGEPLAVLLALSGGSLIYVGASHLIPHVEKEPIRFSFIAVLAGAVMAVIIGATEHGHGGYGHGKHEEKHDGHHDKH